jgi:hypothetical protein
VPPPHETGGSIHYLAHNDVPMATDGDDISIHSTEMEMYESPCHREFGHTHVYDVNLLEWMKSFPSSSELLVGENSTMSHV